MSKDFFSQREEQFADMIIKSIESSSSVWEKGWHTNFKGLPIPHNPFTGTRYKGINGGTLGLATIINGYESMEFMTFNQTKELGGFIKKGEKSLKVSFTFYLEKMSNEKLNSVSDEVKKKYFDEIKKLSPAQLDKLNKDGVLFIVRSFPVFNLSQCGNIDESKLNDLRIKHKIPTNDEFTKLQFIENPFIESILQNSKIEIRFGGNRAYYNPSGDFIGLPPKENFKSIAQYYSTALHELGHSTGHKSRLNRDLSGSFGSVEYAKEELRAEIYSLIQAFDLGLDYNLLNHASYLKNWNKILQDSKDEIRLAIKDALKINEFVKKQWYPKENHLANNNEINHHLGNSVRLDDKNEIVESIKESLEFAQIAPNLKKEILNAIKQDAINARDNKGNTILTYLKNWAKYDYYPNELNKTEKIISIKNVNKVIETLTKKYGMKTGEEIRDSIPKINKNKSKQKSKQNSFRIGM